jgi:hypothetical protein
MSYCKEETCDVEALASLAGQLPISNYYLLSWLTSHLSRVAYFCDINKMTLSNLSLIFCPTLQLETRLFNVLVEHAQEIFPLSDDGMLPASSGQRGLERSPTYVTMGSISSPHRPKLLSQNSDAGSNLLSLNGSAVDQTSSIAI